MLVILQHFKAFCTSFALRMFWVFQTSYYLCSHKEFFASKTKQNIAKGTVAKSLPENQPIARNALLQRVVAFLSKVTEIFCMADDFCKFFDAMTIKYTLKPTRKRIYQALPEPMALQRGTSYKIKCRKDKHLLYLSLPYFSVFYKQLIPIETNSCKLFSYYS